MQKGIFGKAYSPVIYLFIGLTSVFLALQYIFPKSGVNYNVLMMGNLLLFIVAMISAAMSIKALRHQNVQVFLRLVYGSFMLKFFVLAIVAFIYISIYKKEINKPALFTCFGLYFIYTFIEVRSVMKQMKLRKNTNA